MALSIADLGLDKQIIIDTAEAMSVTFPDYVTLTKQLGADIELTD
jgi:5-enolpyruvylshikimate-3-phosphate synthase